MENSIGKMGGRADVAESWFYHCGRRISRRTAEEFPLCVVCALVLCILIQSLVPGGTMGMGGMSGLRGDECIQMRLELKLQLMPVN